MTRRPRQVSPPGEKPFSSRSTPSQRDLADALGKYLKASDWLAGLRVLLSHPVLLTERVSKLLREGADAARRQGNVADETMMLTHLVFLEDVRRRGFFVVHNDLYDKSAKH